MVVHVYHGHNRKNRPIRQSRDRHKQESTCHDIDWELNIFDDRSTSTSTMAPFSSEIWSCWSSLRKCIRFLAIFTSRRTDVSAMFRNSTLDGAASGWRTIELSNDIWKAWITYRYDNQVYNIRLSSVQLQISVPCSIGTKRASSMKINHLILSESVWQLCCTVHCAFMQ